MPFISLIPAGMSLLGGLLGSEEKTVGKTEATGPRTSTTNSSHGSSSVTQQKLDPRMEAAIYGTGGIVPTAQDWYNKNRSGLNEQMITGMNNQWNQLGASKQGFDQMQNLGMGLMGGGAAGNPFTGSGGIAPQKLTFKPAEFSSGNVSGGGSSGNNPFSVPVATAPVAAAMPAPSGDGGGGGGGGYYEQPAQVEAPAAPAAPAVDPRGVWVDDVEGGMWRPHGYSQNGGSGYRPQDWSNPSMNVPTTSTAGYGGYGGYSTSPAYSYPSNGGGGD